MIKVDRTIAKAPEILTNPKKKGVKETLKAISHFTGKNAAKKFKFTAYSHHTVKDALIKLFNGKCAYCESLFLHAYSGDVEHFRPKLEITEAAPKKPGYYWLAAEWTNLLLSCRNCNQKLSHVIYGLKDKKTMGKMNQFPLKGKDKYRAKSHLDLNQLRIENGYRLLINPCEDDPANHIEFDETNGVIKGKTEMGNTSIEVYVLQRTPLVHARQKVLIEIFAQIQRVTEAAQNVANNDESEPAVQRYFDLILQREFKRLYQFMDASEPYSGMANQVIKKFLFDSFGITT